MTDNLTIEQCKGISTIVLASDTGTYELTKSELHRQYKRPLEREASTLKRLQTALPEFQIVLNVVGTSVRIERDALSKTAWQVLTLKRTLGTTDCTEYLASKFMFQYAISGETLVNTLERMYPFCVSLDIKIEATEDHIRVTPIIKSNKTLKPISPKEKTGAYYWTAPDERVLVAMPKDWRTLLSTAFTILSGDAEYGMIAFQDSEKLIPTPNRTLHLRSVADLSKLMESLEVPNKE